MHENLNIHQGLPIKNRGKPLAKASAAMILIHGRGASADSILTLEEELHHDSFTYLAPQAANATWYPYSFMSPIENNEPWLTSALLVLEQTLKTTQNAGIPSSRTIFVGFSQGACLTIEFIARNPQLYGGAAILSGGLIGPSSKEFYYQGSLENTPIFMGCSDIDPHIPLKRVHETTRALRQLGSEVTERIYPGMGHTINQDELGYIRKMMEKLIS